MRLDCCRVIDSSGTAPIFLLRRDSDIHRPDRLLFPFPRAMLRVEDFAMADDNQRAAATRPARPEARREERSALFAPARRRRVFCVPDDVAGRVPSETYPERAGGAEGPRDSCLGYISHLRHAIPRQSPPLKSEGGEEKANPASGIRNRAKSLKTLERDPF
jgi:hypothetical protein